MKESEKIQLLSDLISFETVGENETSVADYLAKIFQQYGIKSEKVNYAPNRDNLVVQIGSTEGPVLAYSGHQDVVHPGNRERRDSDPFKATIKDGKIYGRGTSDMKAGLAAMVIAIIELHEEQVDLNGTLRLLVTVGEEVGELGSEKLRQDGYADDIDALITGEPTVVPTAKLKEYFASGAAHIDEADYENLRENIDENKFEEQNFVFFAHKGWVTTKVTSHGKPAHSSMPGLGINAIDGIVKFYERQKELFDGLTTTSSILGGTVYAATIIEGGHQINSIPGEASLKTKIRTIPEVSNESIIKQLKGIIAELNEEPDTNLTMEYATKPPVISDPNSKLINIVRKVTAKTLDEAVPVPPLAVSLGTDASELTQGNDHMDVAIIGPGNDTAHQINEYVTERMYFDMIETYKLVALEYLK